MFPVVAAVVIGGILYLISQEDQDEKGKQDGEQKKSKPESSDPNVAELRSQLKKALKEKKRREDLTKKTAASSGEQGKPVSPPKAHQPGSTTSGNGKKPEGTPPKK